MLFAYTSICVELWKMPIIRKDYGSNDNSKDIVTVKLYVNSIVRVIPS